MTTIKKVWHKSTLCDTYQPEILKTLIVFKALDGELSYENATTLIKSCKLKEV